MLIGPELPFSAPAVAHSVEYYRLVIIQNDSDGTHEWAQRFVLAWMDNAIDECGVLLAGIKGSGLQLSPHSQGIVMRCQALLELLLEDYHRCETDFRRSLALFEQTGDDFNGSRVLNDLGTLYQAQGDLTRAAEHYRQALERLLPRWAGQTEEAMMHNNLGLALVSQGEMEAGGWELEQALALYRQLGQPQGLARTQINLGQIYRRSGELERAAAAYQEAMDVLRSFGEQRVLAEVMNSLGVLARQQGRFEEAIDYYTRSLAQAQQVQDFGGQAQALGNMGAAYQFQGRVEQAHTCYQEALALHEMVGDVRGQALTRGNLGHLASMAERPEEALACYERSLILHRQSGDILAIGGGLVNLGNALRELGRLADAEALYQEALATGRKQQDLRLQAAALSALGTLRMKQERWSEAETLLNEALALQQQRGDTYAQVEVMIKFGMMARTQDATEEQLVEVLRPAWELAQAHGYGRWLVNMAWLLGDAAFEQGAFGAYNYYATAAVIARQHDDERRYRKSVEWLTRHVKELVRLGEPKRALFLCDYLITYWRENSWDGWVEDAIAGLTAMAMELNVSERAK